MRKRRCPRCGSKKIRGDIKGWICKVCRFTWDERTRRSKIRKDKVRF